MIDGDVPSVDVLAGAPSLFSTAFDLGDVGYVVEELVCSGVASSAAGDRAPYTTRLVVHRPVDPARANGVVVVEWLNVSGGFDVPAFWLWTHRHLVRGGFTWVGVTAQHVGVHGGSGVLAESGLRAADPERYAALRHPGDEYAFDVFTQAGRLARERFGADVVLAVGESQSALYLVTYVNEVAFAPDVFDGYLLQGRPGGAAPLDGSFVLRLDAPRLAGCVPIRDDVAAPVFVVQSETDVLGRLEYYAARQADSTRFRLWEVAGAAHCDSYFLLAAPLDSGALSVEDVAARVVAADRPLGLATERPVNTGPQMHFVMHAALDHLVRWVHGEVPPPCADRLTVLDDGGRLAFELDEVGNVRGGVRTPWVDVPVATLSGLGQPGDLGQLFGTTTVLDARTLAARYPGGISEYAVQFDASTTATADAGFFLAADAAEIAALGTAMAAAVWPDADDPRAPR